MEEYWARRTELKYYKLAKAWTEEFSAPAGTILDVGGRGTPAPTWGTFQRRLALDLDFVAEHLRQPGVEYIHHDWLKYQSPAVEVVLCLQVLEHLNDEVVEKFARKLLLVGHTAIVSVPYRWPKGSFDRHLQDPVDLEKLVSWMGASPIRHEVVNDGVDRLIAIFKGRT